MQGEIRKECLRTLCVYMRAACAGDWQFGESKSIELWPHGRAATYTSRIIFILPVYIAICPKTFSSCAYGHY
jgi:hypothetical protein